MAADTRDALAYHWTTQPEAEALVREIYDAFHLRCPPAKAFEKRLLQLTGTRLLDWTDYLEIPEDSPLAARLADVGFRPIAEFDGVWRHPGGLFPTLGADRRGIWRMAIHVESVVDFLAANGLDDSMRVEGYPLSQFRRAKVFEENGAEFWALERHGTKDLAPNNLSRKHPDSVVYAAESFRLRRRRFEREEDGFAHAMELIGYAVNDLGADWACDLFFAAEREYWMRRNTAAQIQKARQDRLGLGWGNHDHHTYRSSREHFRRLIAAFEALGLVCRERFYAGREAGWGAQVLEQPTAGIVVFADVDLAPEEVMGDFAHEPLPPRQELGTVGLWCKLHGEAFLQAGMHHLECQFAFDAAQAQLAESGVVTMKPFTDFDYLRQAFTQGEIWPVDPARLEAALAEGYITTEQAEKFRREGTLGSHLEILQRDEGYKGFNQTGVSEIIQRTDPRRCS